MHMQSEARRLLGLGMCLQLRFPACPNPFWRPGQASRLIKPTPASWGVLGEKHLTCGARPASPGSSGLENSCEESGARRAEGFISWPVPKPRGDYLLVQRCL